MLTLLTFSCKKDKVHKTTISGVVINKTTKTPVSNLAVVFSSTKDTRRGFLFGKTVTGKYEESKLISTTDNNGNFTFSDASIHSNPDYDYQLFTSSYISLYNGRTDFGDAKQISFDKGNLNKFYELEVTPLMDYLWVQLNPTTPIFSPDSVSINFTHKYFYNNQPSGSTLTTYQLKNGNKAYALQRDVMGQWYINIYKFKGGVSYNLKDSVFLNYGDTLTYKLNF